MTARWTTEDLDAYIARLNRPIKATRSLTSQGVGQGPTPIASPAKRPKYRNVKVTDASGAVHDSTKEFRRWQVLELRQRAGEIRSLRRQVPYALVVNGVLVCQYVCDFDYIEGEARVVEDCKSPPTRKLAAYSIKRKLMMALHGIQIREV